MLAWLSLPCSGYASDSQAWDALREGRALLLLRHASAPGFGDPANFQLGDCTTQRNLSEQGREESRSWGTLLRSQRIEQPRLFSSRWCRARDTAREMDLGAVEPLPALENEIASTIVEWFLELSPGLSSDYAAFIREYFLFDSTKVADEDEGVTCANCDDAGEVDCPPCGVSAMAVAPVQTTARLVMAPNECLALIVRSRDRRPIRSRLSCELDSRRLLALAYASDQAKTFSAVAALRRAYHIH